MKLKKIIEPQGRAGEVDEEPCEARKKKVVKNATL